MKGRERNDVFHQMGRTAEERERERREEERGRLTPILPTAKIEREREREKFIGRLKKLKQNSLPFHGFM